MFWQLFGISGLLVLFSLTMVGIVISRRIEQNQLGQIEGHLRAKALLLQELIRGQDLAISTDLLRRWTHLQTEESTRITLINAAGKVVAETSDDPTYLDNHSERPEVVEARTNGVGVASRYSTTIGQPMMYVALRADGNPNVAIIRVSLPLTKIHAEIAGLTRLIWTAAGITSLLSLALAFWLVRRFCRPLQELSEGADKIASGAHGYRVWVRGPKEMRQLAESFNNMSERLTVQISQLEEDRQQLRTVLSSMVEGVIAVDPDQRVLFANDRAGQLLNFPPARAVGRPLLELIRQRLVHDIVRVAMYDGQDHSRELVWNGPATRSLSVHVARLPGSPPRGAVLVFHDNTELRRLENLRQEFAANVSHELKTPLSTIKACVETLIDGAVDDPSHRGQFLERIAEQSERLHRLILDLLHLSRIESETEIFSFDELDIAAEVGTCLERHRTLAENKRQRLDAQPPPADQLPVIAWADEEAFQQILDNLVDNALKYTPEDGSIIIRWGREDKEIFLEVRDTGIGIPENELPRIFERFYRVDKARSRELGGTGLGLSIVKHLSQAMHGSVEAKSQVGQGTTFTVKLPSPD